MNKITRREFLESTGAAVLATTPAYGQEKPDEPYFADSVDGFVVRWNEKDILILRSACIVPGATNFIRHDKTLAIARLDGVDRRRVDFELRQSDGQWSILATWQFLRVPAKPHVSKIIVTDTVPLPTSPGSVVFRARLEAGQPAALAKLLTAEPLTCPNRAVLVFDSNAREAATAIVTERDQQFSAFDKRFAGRRLLLAPLSAETSMRLVNDRASAVVDIVKDKHLQLHLQAAKDATASFGHDQGYLLEGPLELLIHNPSCEATSIPCHSASRILSAGDQTWTINPTGDPWRLNTPRTSFEARVAEDGTEHARSRPIEISIRNGKLKQFSVDARLTSTTLAVADADRTRFDLGGISLQLCHTPPPAPKTKTPPHIRPIPTFAYTVPDAVLQLPLPDCAKLRLWRGQDLFCLGFQFHNIDLAIGKTVELVPLRPEQMDPANRPDEAVLLAEFPPQHIMERSFLRQDRPLPDAGKEIAPAQLRQLQRLQPADGESQRLRDDIQREKREDEKNDLKGEKYFPFGAFADEWDKNNGNKFGHWIGPAGLFSVEARRAARKFAEERRLSRLSELIRKAAQKFTPPDFGDAAEILARPAFPMSRAEASDWLRKNIVKGVRKQITRDDLTELWKEASRRSEDFREFQDFSLDRGTAATHSWLLLPDWPLSEDEIQSVCTDQGPSPNMTPPTRLTAQQQQQQDDRAQAALIARLEAFQKAQSDTLREYSTGDALKRVPEGFRRPVEAWVSEPSRLAFAISDNPVPFTTAKLTAWENFELRVVQRARRLYGQCTLGDPRGESEESSPERILRLQGIAVDEPKVGNDRVLEIANRVKEPDKFDTALEIPTGLILSPAQDARWITPRKLPPALVGTEGWTIPTPVWQARLLERKKGSSLRAIWSTDFANFRIDTFLKGAKQPDRWKAPNGQTYRTAMSPQDQAEIVALTSIYGLPVIASKDKEVSSQIAPPNDKYISDGAKNMPIAIYMPVPLQARRLALGATGAMLDLDTTFPLVTSAKQDSQGDGYFRSFSLQRWRSLISDGSDVITSVVRRGYLFPLCHKASLVKITEPRLRPIDPARPAFGYTVEQATHIYIEVTRASHHYPAVAQSFEARDFQPREITLLTLRTPDLVDPADDKPFIDRTPLAGTSEERLAAINGMLQQPTTAGPHGSIRGWVDRRGQGEDARLGQMAGLVFWPRTEVGTKGTVRFRMRIDGQPTPISMPLVFADHRAADDPKTMKALADYYKGGVTDDKDKPKDWRKVQHNGALRTYADEQRKGQCTFTTDWQLLEAVEGNSGFAFNSELVAAEQPPFYPRMERAQIRPQQIQGLTGAPAPTLEVKYAENYVHYGFNPPEKCGIADPDTFLLVTNDPKPKLDMGDHGDQGGTVARPAKEICGLNRRFGIAGPPLPAIIDCDKVVSPPPPQGQGQGTQGQNPPPPQTTTLPLLKDAPTAFPAPKVCNPVGTPANNLSKDLALGHFGEDATLFGLIKLRDFIAVITGELGSHVPLLEEITNFTGEQLLNVAKTLQEPISNLAKQLEKNAGTLLFPDFACALNDLHRVLEDVVRNPPSQTEKQLDAATTIWTLGQRVVRELETIARTPISEFAERLRFYLLSSQQEIARQFQAFAPWNEIQDRLAELVAGAAKELPEAVVALLDTGADKDELKKFVKETLAKVVGRIDIWKSKTPLDNIAKAVGPLPAGVIGLGEGPLYKLAGELVSIAEQNFGNLFDKASLSTALQWAIDAIKKAEGVQKQIDDLVKLGAAACAHAIGSLRKLLDAVVDSSSGKATAAVKKIEDLIKAIKKTRSDIESNAGDFKPAVAPMLTYLDDWEKLLTALSKKLADQIAKTQTVAENAVNSLPGSVATTVLPDVVVCGRFVEGSIGAIAGLTAKRQELLHTWLDFAALFPKVAPPAPPIGATALLPYWRDIQRQMTELVRSAMLDAETIALRYVTADGQDLWKKATDDLATLATTLPVGVQQALNDALKSQRDAIDDLAKAQKQLTDDLANIPSNLTPDPAAVHKLINENIPEAIKNVVDGAGLLKAEADLLEKVLRPAMAKLLADNFKPDLDKAAAGVLEQIRVVYDAVRKQRNGAYRAIQRQLNPNQGGTSGILDLIKSLFGPPQDDTADACTDGWDKFLLLVPRADHSCVDEDNDALADETKEIATKKTAADLKEILERWQKGSSAPQRILRHIEYFARVGVRSNITKVLDVEYLRQQIADALANALPTTRTLKSSLLLPLKETSVGIGTFRPIDDKKTLTLSGKATVDLLHLGVPKTTVRGEVTAFELEILSIMTFTFRSGVTYEKGENDGRGKITAKLGADDIKFGDKLSFLAELAKSFSFGGSGKDKTGPYTIVHIDNPSIEAGYRIAIPVITLGVTFTNINFAGALVLPFSSGSARVRAALGSLDNPFMISAGIYGGTGFMALEASPQGIEAFEAAFQFGGVASLGYGPLQGTAYVTTGAYVRKDQLGCTFAALFSAGFTAHIACFGISAAFTLRLYKRSGDSSVSGEAQLTFTFSLGRFLEVSYTIRVARSMQAGFGGGGKQAASLPGTGVQVAALGNFAPSCFPTPQAAIMQICSPSPEETWSSFEALFDPDFVPEALK